MKFFRIYILVPTCFRDPRCFNATCSIGSFVFICAWTYAPKVFLDRT